MEYTFFIDKIRKLRKEAGYTQEDVSRKLNIQRQQPTATMRTVRACHHWKSSSHLLISTNFR